MRHDQCPTVDDSGWDEYYAQWARAERHMLGVVEIGPLTMIEQEKVSAYEQHMIEQEKEHEAQDAAGGRTICPACGNRSVTHRGVYTLGWEGHPGAEMSDFAKCETPTCGYAEV
jgi:hypothetical protein